MTAHLRDVLLSATAALAACLAFVAVLYLFAPVEWPAFSAPREIADRVAP